MRLRLDDETVAALRRYRDEGPQSEILPNEDCVALYGGLGMGLLLTLDGRVIEEDWLAHRAWEVADQRRIWTALVLGKERISELERLLPKRPEEAKDCAECAATGWAQVGEVAKAYVCGECGGLGWK